MKLYFSPGACSMAPHIVLNELNMVFEAEMVNMKDKTCSTGDFTKINPKGAVPVLRLENGEILTEGAVISSYLADLKGDSTLIPKFGTLERVRLNEWMNFIATDFHKSFSPMWITGMISANPDAQNDIKKFYTDSIYKKVDYVSQKLGNHDYLMGKNFTVADAYLFTVLGWTKHLNMDLSKWSNITAWMSRVYARPAVQKTMKAEGLLK